MKKRSHNILTVVGARPQFVKAAALSRAFAGDDRFCERIVHTGQHFDANMSDRFFNELAIPAPAHNLRIAGGGHGEMTGRMVIGIEELLLAERPDAVLVYGDTNSTFAAALAAVKLHIPVVHVEAGLRSHNRRMPEEINRVLTDHASDLLLCPTHLAVENLASEGIRDGVHHVGDVMYDATLFAGEHAQEASRILNHLSLEAGHFVLATVHRAENTDDPTKLAAVIAELERQAETHRVILPLHPRTAAALARYNLPLRKVETIDPVGYLDMHAMMAAAALVVTDSGGVQKEAYFHGVPCLTLREETEWVETIDAGWNRLWTHDDYRPRRPISDYGDGNAAGRCVAVIADHLDAHQDA